MRKVTRLIPFQQNYGGNHYEEAVTSVFKKNDILCETICLTPKTDGILYKVIKFFLWIFNSYRVHTSFTKGDICITPFEGTLFLGKEAKNIVIIHHIDAAYSPLYTSIINWLCTKYLSLFDDRVFKYVVVSEYWKNYLIAIGVKEEKISIIYNFLGPVEKIDMGEKKDFLQKHGIKTDKIIYIGNHQKKKGVEVVSQSLASLFDITLISSGNHSESCSVSANTKHLKLSYEDYIRVLYFSELVITYSLFKEGWCRSAHEALALGKYVIGSGAGGMTELLELCGIHPVKMESLKSETENILASNVSVNANNLLEKTDYRTFQKKWLAIIGLLEE